MVNNGIVNVVAFAANYLSKVSWAATRDILVGDMFTQIAEFLSFEFNLSEDHVVEGKCKIDMEALVHQGMIYMDETSMFLTCQIQER